MESEEDRQSTNRPVFGSHNLDCCLLRTIRLNGKNGHGVAFKASKSPGKIVLGVDKGNHMQDICFPIHSSERHLARVSIRGGSFILKNLAIDSVNAPVLGGVPVQGKTAIPVGAVFTIRQFSFCVECDESKHKRERSPERQIQEVRTCTSCAVRETKKWRFKDGALLCDICYHRLWRAVQRPQERVCGIPEISPENSHLRTAQLDLSCGKSIIYLQGALMRKANIVDNTIVLRNASGYFKAQATDVAWWSEGWRYGTELRLRDGRLGNVVGIPIIEVISLRLKRGHYVLDAHPRTVEIWKIVSNLECKPVGDSMPDFSMLRSAEDVDCSVGKCVEMFTGDSTKGSHRYAMIASNTVVMETDMGQIKVNATDIMAKSDGWNIGSIVTLRDGRTGVLTRRPTIQANWFLQQAKKPIQLNQHPNKIYMSLIKCNVEDPRDVEQLRSAMESRTVEH